MHTFKHCVAPALILFFSLMTGCVPVLKEYYYPKSGVGFVKKGHGCYAPTKSILKIEDGDLNYTIQAEPNSTMVWIDIRTNIQRDVILSDDLVIFRNVLGTINPKGVSVLWAESKGLTFKSLSDITDKIRPSRKIRLVFTFDELQNFTMEITKSIFSDTNASKIEVEFIRESTLAFQVLNC